MIFGIGIDIVENQRVERLLAKWGESLLERIFLPGEVAYCLEKKFPAPCLAARIAVKEAVMKSFGEGWTERIGWKDIRVLHAQGGRPEVELLGKGKQLAQACGVRKILISLSHSEHYSVAQALILGGGGAAR